MDLEDLDRRLQALAADRRRLDKLRRDDATLQQQLADARGARREWVKAVEEASGDLRKLEGVSLGGLFLSLFGDRKLRIHDEKERLLQAKLRHDECEAAIEPLEQKQAEVRAEITAIGDLDARRDALLADKEQVLRERGGEAAEKLVASAARLGELKDERRELEEAIEAGRRVLPELQGALSELGGAATWGTFDLLGGGMITSMAKHGRIDEARRYVERAQRHLRDFVRELGDVDVDMPRLGVEIGEFTRFADVFFDCLISDWIVQRRISDARDRVRDGKDRVQHLVFELERRAREARAAESAAIAERQRWIEESS